MSSLAHSYNSKYRDYVKFTIKTPITINNVSRLLIIIAAIAKNLLTVTKRRFI